MEAEQNASGDDLSPSVPARIGAMAECITIRFAQPRLRWRTRIVWHDRQFGTLAVLPEGGPVPEERPHARPSGTRRSRIVYGMIAASVAAHLVLIGWPLAAAGPDTAIRLATTPPPGGAQVELVQQDTSSGGGDRYIQGEGQADRPARQARQATPVHPPEPAPAPPPDLVALAPPARPAPLRPTSRPKATQPPVQANSPADRDGGSAGTGQIVSGKAVIPASVDTAAHNASPAYPPTAMLLHEQGSVRLLVRVRPDGGTDGVDVLRSSGSARLDDAARETVMGWHSKPGRAPDGRLIASSFEITIEFGLDGPRLR